MSEQKGTKKRSAKSHNAENEGWVSSRLGNAKSWHHALFFACFTAEFVGDLETDLHRVALSYVNSIHEHFLLNAVLLLRCNIPARLGPKLQCVRLRKILVRGINTNITQEIHDRTTYFFHSNLEMKLSDGLSSVVGEDSNDVNLARLVGHTTRSKINAQLRVQNLNFVCRWKGIAGWKG